jgi:transcriptional regulator with XRE-family HTH domain
VGSVLPLVAQLRREHDWTQKQLAAATGIDQGFISRMEAGLMEPCLVTLATLATAFDVTLAELMKDV